MSLLRRLETLSHNVSTERNFSNSNNLWHTNQKTIKKNRQHCQRTHIKIISEHQPLNHIETTQPELPKIDFGNNPTKIDQRTTLRWIGGNIRGVKPSKIDTILSPALNRINDLDASILTLIETNVDWRDQAMKRNIRNTIKDSFIQCHSTFSTSRTSSKHLHKPGGTATFALGRWSGKVVESGADETGCGRFSWITIQGKHNKKCTFVSTYKSGKQEDITGNSQYAQEYRIQ